MEKRCPHCGRHPELQAHRTSDGPALKGAICFTKFDYLWERDLLLLAHGYPRFRKLANELGFRDEKIDAPWTFPDEGRYVCLGPISAERNEELWGPFVREARGSRDSAQQMASLGEDADGDAHGL